MTSDEWIERNDGDNFVKGGFLYQKGFWGRKVRRLVLTEKSLRLLVRTADPPLPTDSLSYVRQRVCSTSEREW